MQKKPNIIYILSDEHRGQAMRHMGDINLNTPNMDKLAADGVSFKRAYSNCPICTPARGTIFSGRHAHSGPVSGFFDVFKPAAPSTATVLRENGYHTAYFGKWHCGVIRDQYSDFTLEHQDEFPGNASRTPENMRAGFQDWYGFECLNHPFQSYVYINNDENPTKLEKFQTDALTDYAVDYIDKYDKGNPFFLVLSVEPPHFPCTPPQKWQRDDYESLEVRPNFGELDPFFAQFEPEIDEMTFRKILANYYGMIENLDWNIGRVIECLEQKGLLENTLIVYISDHGDYVGSHGLRTTKIHHHEESISVPAIFHLPGKIPAQGNIDGLFSLVDVMATTLGLVGIDVPCWNQGSNFTPAIIGQEFDGPEDVLIEMVNNPRWDPRFTDWRGLVNDKYKYAFYEDGREVLHDLEDDPYEMTDLAEAQPAICKSLRQRLLEMLKETREPFFDVIIQHGVDAEKTNYIDTRERKRQGVLHMGGLAAENNGTGGLQ